MSFVRTFRRRIGGRGILVEARRDHVALLDLGDLEHRQIEGVERGGAGVIELDLNEGDMAFAGLLAVDDGGVAADVTFVLEPADARLDRRLGETDPGRLARSWKAAPRAKALRGCCGRCDPIDLP